MIRSAMKNAKRRETRASESSTKTTTIRNYEAYQIKARRAAAANIGAQSSTDSSNTPSRVGSPLAANTPHTTGSAYQEDGTPHEAASLDSVTHEYLNIQYDVSDPPANIIRVIDDRRSRHARRKHAQAYRWNTTVLPALIRPYMKFRREQRCPRVSEEPSEADCKCGSRHHMLGVICVHMERIEDIMLDICDCRPAPLQLVQRGFFPCAPVRPTLAVSLDMLEFVAELFLHVAPNERGWAETVVKYLKTRGYCFATGDSFRRRFANALAHYQQLVQLVNAEVEKLVNCWRDEPRVGGEPSMSTSIPELDGKTPVSERQYLNAQSDVMASSNLDCPSAYLKSRCPLCFGSNNAEVGGLSVNSIICIDANFQLKRQRDLDRRAGHKGETGAQDPIITSPKTIELSRKDLEAWETRVLSIRPGQGSSRIGRKRKAGEALEADEPTPDDDRVEDNLKMPNSTYSACGESFIAADGDRIKASTQYFSDTGVLAALCRHDIPLVMANMWTAGEKQFYVFALIDALMKHLPCSWRIGVLYDIGCQIDESLKKWNFMPEWSSRLEWGVSIFHAYGHQWTCQLWYHPRKSEIWGLSDGEGCERFWSELRRLIPGLRVTGYHRRLFILDLQVEHIDEGKRESVGKWLHDHFKRAQDRLDEAEDKLDGLSTEYLLEQFKEQRRYHSQPMSRQAQTQGARAIERILSLQSTLDTQRENYQELVKEGNDMVAEDSASEAVLEEWRGNVNSTKAAIAKLEKDIKTKTNELKLGDRVAAQKLSKLKRDKWIALQLNLRVLREQLVRKLRARKFELATLDRTHSTRILDQKTKAHVEKAVKHRSSGVEATMNKYNAKLVEMSEYRRKSKSISQDAYIPPLLSKEGLYKLDVDQDIWEDARGDIADFPDGVIPKWLTDVSVKRGICVAQEVVNCRQELERCKAEHSNLWAWFSNEYAAVGKLVTSSQDEDVSFFALVRLHQLYDWLETWRKHLALVPSMSNIPRWDDIRTPTPLEQHHMRQAIDVSLVQDGDDLGSTVSSDDDDNGELEEDVQPEDLGFITLLDNALVDLDN
jgi:Kyakuja-Dileera-Zisupton transposase/CxC1 like cysteine cluster associated with KDZ transposases